MNANSEGNKPVESMSRQEARQMRREMRRASRGGAGAWIGGLVLIVIGVVFLLQNMGTVVLENWWALFILIPAAGAFGNAYSDFQSAGRLTASSRGSIIGGLVLSLVAAVFLFNWNWLPLLPVLLILVGIGVLVNGMLPG